MHVARAWSEYEQVLNVRARAHFELVYSSVGIIEPILNMLSLK